MSRNDVQGWLELEPRPRRIRRHTTDSQRDGLASVAPRARSQNMRILEALARHGQCTRNELAALTELPLASVCRAVNALISAEKVREPLENGRPMRRLGTLRNLVELTVTHPHRA